VKIFQLSWNVGELHKTLVVQGVTHAMDLASHLAHSESYSVDGAMVTVWVTVCEMVFPVGGGQLMRASFSEPVFVKPLTWTLDSTLGQTTFAARTLELAREQAQEDANATGDFVVFTGEDVRECIQPETKARVTKVSKKRRKKATP